LRVSLNDVELYCGELPQGCGNQIFDYCHKVELDQRQIADSADSGPLTRGGEMSQLEASSQHASSSRQSTNTGQSLVIVVTYYL